MPLFIPPVVRATDASANALSGAKRYFYESGGLVPATVYADSELTTPLSNPVVADSGGLFVPIYYDASVVLRVIERKANGDLIQDIDPYNDTSSLGDANLLTTLSAGATNIRSDSFRTSGYSEVGLGSALYAYDADVDEAYVAANPRTAFLSVTGEGYRLAETVRTPYMFGALGIRAGDTAATMADDYDALQAFFEDAFPIANRAFTYDFQGEWGTSRQIFATYPLDQDSGQDQSQRRFICGKIVTLPLNRQPGGVPMDYILTIAGYSQNWEGMLYLSALPEGNAIHPYNSRCAKNGLQLFGGNFSLFQKVSVEGVQRDAVYFDPALVSTTFRSGTPFEVTYAYSNNIGVRIESLHGRWCGAYYGEPATYSKNWTAMAHGGMSVGTFDPTPASYANSTNQRTKLTFDSTTDFRKYDYGKTRLETLPATYGTIAADGTASTLTWSAGDPVAAGLVVGDIIIPQSGANSGKRLEILGFSGGSNRVIAVSSRLQVEASSSSLVTETATALTGLYTRWAPYMVMDVLSSTEVLVWPWIEDRAGATGKWTFMHGHVANVTGNNTATVTIGILVGLAVSSTLNAQCLYGPGVDSVLAEFSEIGVTIGTEYGNVHLGTETGPIHAEGCEFNIIQATSSNNSHVNIGCGSNFYMSRVWPMISKATAGDALMPVRPLNFMTLTLGGQTISNRQDPSYSGTTATNFTVTNRLEQRECVKALNGTLVCTLDFAFETARLAGNHHWAKVFWVNPLTGGAPAGSLDFQLSAELTLRGWTILGTHPITSPSKACEVKAVFLKETGKVTLTRYDAA